MSDREQSISVKASFYRLERPIKQPVDTPISWANKIVSEFLTGMAHPTNSPGWHSSNEREIRYVARDYCTRSHKGISPNRHTADHCTIRTQGGTPAHERRKKFVLPLNLGARIEDVGEHHRRPTEHPVFERHCIIYRDVVLYLYAVAYNRSATDINTLP